MQFCKHFAYVAYKGAYLCIFVSILGNLLIKMHKCAFLFEKMLIKMYYAQEGVTVVSTQNMSNRRTSNEVRP